MRAIAYVASFGLAAAGLVAAFAPGVAAVPNDLSSFCPDYSTTPRCQAAVGLFLAGKPGDDAIISAVNAIIDRAHDKHLSGKACDDSEAALKALAAATHDAGSRSLIAGIAANLCTGAVASVPEPFVVHGATGSGSGHVGSSGSSGQSSGNSSGGNSSGSSGSSGQSTGSSGDESSGNNSGTSGSSGSSGQSTGSSGDESSGSN